jgi:chemotaxis protein MotC
MRSLALWLCTLAILLAVPAGSEEPSAAGADATKEEEAPATVHTAPLLRDLDALFLLQDAAARGRRDAATLQKPLLVSIGERLGHELAALPARLAPYVAGYVLSGGDPATADALASSERILPADRRLLEGASRFMRGERAEARIRLEDIDTASLPARIAGRVALAQALLEDDAAMRQSGLSLAMALMPGTLVEESALRRSALGYADTREEQPFWNRLERYQRRFPNSLYARPFWEEIMTGLAAWATKDKAPDLARLDLILQEMPVSRRRDLYLHLTRQSSSSGNGRLVMFAGGRALRLAKDGSREEQTARFYLSLYGIASDRSGQALAQLKALNPALLGLREQALLAAGLSLAEQINRPADVPGGGATDNGREKSELQKRGESLIVDVDRILAESSS